jgi:hypothetical protein
MFIYVLSVLMIMNDTDLHVITSHENELYEPNDQDLYGNYNAVQTNYFVLHITRKKKGVILNPLSVPICRTFFSSS